MTVAPPCRWKVGAEAREALVEDAGGVAIRVVKLSAHLTPPQITEAEVEVPDEAGETQQVEVKAA
jgi:hypothetical protein